MPKIENAIRCATDYGYFKALDDLIERLECIDPCDFAMYSLELIKENVRELKEYRNEQR